LQKKTKGAIELTRLYLFPEMIGKKVAHLLVNACVDFVKAHQQYNSIWLHVYEGNVRARRFYEKAGFSIGGIQLHPVRNSVPTGIVMKLEVV
jgi:ribosomal protein S18 acetylase RimI-like enzyme